MESSLAGKKECEPTGLEIWCSSNSTNQACVEQEMSKLNFISCTNSLRTWTISIKHSLILKGSDRLRLAWHHRLAEWEEISSIPTGGNVIFKSLRCKICAEMSDLCYLGQPQIFLLTEACFFP